MLAAQAAFPSGPLVGVHQEFNYLRQFRILKKWRQRLCLGSGARPERAGSIGWASPCLRG